jgi:hypothetical protein
LIFYFGEKPPGISKFGPAGAASSANLHELLEVQLGFIGLLRHFGGAASSVRGVEAIRIDLELSLIFGKGVGWPIHF